MGAAEARPPPRQATPRFSPPDHIGCGATSTDDGKPMSINLEMIGQTLMAQHYAAEIARPELRRMASISDASSSRG